MSKETTIHWFRHDLRLADHPALSAAVARDAAIVPVYVLDDDGDGDWALGGASRWWLHHALAALGQGLEACGSRLVLRRGATVAALLKLAEETGAATISFTRGYDPASRRLEATLQTECKRAGLDLKRYSGALLFEPEAIRTKTGDPFRVFTPFWKACQDAPPPRPSLPAPERLGRHARGPASDSLASWSLLPLKPDWAGGMRATWVPGEAGAVERLSDFLDEAVANYASDRDLPGKPGTSRLSPYLHFGNISPRQCWHSARLAAGMNPAKSTGAATFLREIGWREFSAHLLYHYPHLADTPFRPDFAVFPWSDDKAANSRNLKAWQRGRTGYPIVDAGMRELWQTGWMHNRVRMIVASLLCKHMLIPWQDGARWFWDTLVDADVASNQASWQWVAGSGADAAPYFRIFNPVLQGAKFDPAGDYVRRYVPELAKLPPAHIHRPWEAPPAVLAAAGVTLGKNYPRPIVDHAEGRARALAAYARMKQQPVTTDDENTE